MQPAFWWSSRYVKTLHWNCFYSQDSNHNICPISNWQIHFSTFPECIFSFKCCLVVLTVVLYDRPACHSVWGCIPPVSMWHWLPIKNHNSLWWNYFFLVCFGVVFFSFWVFVSSGFKMYTVLFNFFMGCLNNFLVFLAYMVRQWLFYFWINHFNITPLVSFWLSVSIFFAYLNSSKVGEKPNTGHYTELTQCIEEYLPREEIMWQLCASETTSEVMKRF